MAYYDYDYDERVEGPKEGKSAISDKTRQRLYGNKDNDWGQLLMQLLAQSQQQQTNPAEYFAAKAQAKDPVGWQIKQNEVSRQKRWGDPWAPGGAFEGRGASQMDPAAVMASQGNNAMNQWAQLGANKNITKEQMAQANQGYATGGLPRLDPAKLAGGIQAPSSKGQPISQAEMDEFNRQASLNTPKTYI